MAKGNPHGRPQTSIERVYAVLHQRIAERYDRPVLPSETMQAITVDDIIYVNQYYNQLTERERRT